MLKQIHKPKVEGFIQSETKSAESVSHSHPATLKEILAIPMVKKHIDSATQRAKEETITKLKLLLRDGMKLKLSAKEWEANLINFISYEEAKSPPTPPLKEKGRK